MLFYWEQLFYDKESNESSEVVISDGIIFNTGYESPFSRNRILFGAPGTGKSFTINSDRVELLGEGNEEDYERVTFHPDYSYANFVGTYKPVMVDDSAEIISLASEKEVLAILTDETKSAQEKYDLLYDRFKGDGLTRLSLLLGLYTDESFKTRKADGSDAANDNSVERNHGRAIRPYVNLSKPTNGKKDMADLLDEDIEVVDVEVGENEYLYVFTFVGVIVVAGRVLKCYPKYLLSAKEPTDELRKVIKVLEKYNSKEQIVRMFNDSSESSSFNLLAVLLFILQDYFENGTYTNTEDIIECNGSGEILWDKTINETFTLLSENRPYYIELQTRKRITNDFDYFKRLHECIVTKASKELQDAELLNLFEITGVDLTDEELDDFGDKEYILYRIENELNTQFNTRKQLVLKTMYAYIDRRGSLYDTESLSLFGTNTFNLVWEKICADIMDNQLDAPLGVLKLPVPLKDGYNRRMKLIELIEKPLWTITGKCAKDTLIPDLISICKVNGQHQFIIFDAKYYNAHLETGIAPTGQPGIESVTKQYLYQLAYQKFIEDHNFSSVKNCFLLPTENNEIEDKGEVRMEMLSNLGLQDIKGRLIPATMAYDLYLSGRKMDIADLEL